VPRLAKQKAICKNLMKKVALDTDWQIFQPKNYQTKIMLLKIKKYTQYCFYLSLS
jgi:hypothetical protein